MILLIEEYALVCSLSALGGIGAYLQSVRDNKSSHSFLNFFTEITLSLTVGLAIAYIGHAREWNPAIVCALALILGNNGADTITFLKATLKEFVLKRFGGKK